MACFFGFARLMVFPPFALAIARLLPVAVPSKLAASSPRVLRHHPVIPHTSQETPRAIQGGLKGRMDADSGEDLCSSSETGMLRGRSVGAGSGKPHQHAEGVEDDVKINVTIDIKDQMQRETAARSEGDVLPSSAAPRPPSVPSPPRPHADTPHDAAPEWNVPSDLWRNESATDAWLLCGPGSRDSASSEAGQEVHDARGGDQVLREGAAVQTFVHEPSYPKARPVAEPQKNSWDVHSTGASWIPKEFASYLGAPVYHSPQAKQAEGTSAADQGKGGDFQDHLRAVRRNTFSKVPDSLSQQDNILLETFLVIPKDTSSVLIGRSMGIFPQATAAADQGTKVSEVTQSSKSSSYVAFP